MVTPTKLLGIHISVATITSEDSFKILRSEIINRNPGYAVMVDTEMTFPAKYAIVYHHKLKTATFQEVVNEYFL